MSRLVWVDFEQSGKTKVVLNRPEKLNAFSAQMIQELNAVLQDLTERALDKTLRVVVLCSSSEKAFCAGADLGERMGMSLEQVSKTLEAQRKITDALASLPVPTIAVIEGVALGGGLELALSCDLRVASPLAQMGLSETRLGVIPGAGGTQRLTRLLGASRAKELIFTGRRVLGEEAAQIGLVNVCSPTAEKVAHEWADQILSAGPLAIIAAKRAIDGGLRKKNIDEALDWERECYESCLNSKDRIEGLKAFSEKRSPQYKGE